MNRKMRANLNNKVARERKSRREQKLCDRCGEDFKNHVEVPVVVLGIIPLPETEGRPPGVTLQ